MIPEYLRHISRMISQKEKRTTLALICECGCDDFWLLSNYFTPEEQRQMEPHNKAVEKLASSFIGYECNRDKEGKFHFYKLIFPFFRKEVHIPEAPAFASVECWQAECSECGKQYILFDNRCHGYDGVFCSEDADLNYEPHFRSMKFRDQKPGRLEIVVEHDPTPEQIREENGEDIDDRLRSNAFGWICVRRISEQGKRRTVLEYESA